MSLQTGRVIKDFCGYYLVDASEGVFRCRQRGNLRQPVYVGDQVEFEVLNLDEGRITGILPRRHSLTKPPVANIDQAVVIVSFQSPAFNPTLLDRYLVSLDGAVVILFHKADLKIDQAQVDLYRAAGYTVHCASSVTGEGIADLQVTLAKKSSVLLGPSGVGKSTLVNRLCGQWLQLVNELSEKIQRGKQTTRFVQFFHAGDETYVVDTPGYALGHLPEDIDDLAPRFPEFQARFAQCRFNNCLHRSEPGCIIRAAVETGEIAASRYQSYCEFFEEIKKNERQKY